jgi:hypothetical protein
MFVVTLFHPSTTLCEQNGLLKGWCLTTKDSAAILVTLTCPSFAFVHSLQNFEGLSHVQLMSSLLQCAKSKQLLANKSNSRTSVVERYQARARIWILKKSNKVELSTKY